MLLISVSQISVSFYEIKKVKAKSYNIIYNIYYILYYKYYYELFLSF